MSLRQSRVIEDSGPTLLVNGRKDSTPGGASVLQVTGNLGFARGGTAYFLALVGVHGCGYMLALSRAVLPDISKSSPHALSHDLLFEGRKPGHPRSLKTVAHLLGVLSAQIFVCCFGSALMQEKRLRFKSYAFKHRITGQNLFAPPTPAETDACPCGT